MDEAPQETYPSQEQLIALLKAPGAAPRITLDITNSDGPQEGVAWAELDQNGELKITKVG